MNKNLNKTFSKFETKSFLINDTPVYTLHECLAKSSDQNLDSYLQMLNLKNENNCNTREEKITILEKKLPLSFKEYLEDIAYSDELKIYDEAIKKQNKLQDAFNITLLMSGYIYEFLSNNEIYYIVPNELLNIYKKYIKSGKKHEKDIEKASKYIHLYLMINCLVPIDWLQDVLLNCYHLSISKKDIEDIIEKFEIETYQDKYYSLLNPEDINDNLLNLLLDIKKRSSYLILDERVVNDYLNYLKELTSQITNLLGDDNADLLDTIFNNIAFLYISALGEIRDILEEYKIPIEKQDKILDLLSENIDKIRLWIFNGRNYEEYIVNENIKKNTLKKKPDILDLKSCLKNLHKDNLEDLLENYEVKDVEALANKIIANFKEELQNASLVDLVLLSHNDKLILEDLKELDIKIFKYLFYYQTKNEKQVIIPIDYIPILEEFYAARKTEFTECDDLVFAYVKMNGVLENKKLQELLNNYHDIDISIADLDKIIQRNGFIIVAKKYYSAISDLDKKSALELLNIKENLSEYKKVDFEQINKTLEFEEKMMDLVNKEVSRNSKTAGYIILLAEKGSLTRDTIEVCKEDGLIISDKAIKLILDLYKQYKQYIYCFTFNGYSITEYQKLKQSENVSTRVVNN